MAAADPAKEKPCLLEKLFGMSSTSQRFNVERLLARIDDIVESASGSGLSSADIGNLKCYIHAGDTSVPVPDTKIPTAWQLPEQDIFNCRLADRTAVKCMVASVMFGLRHDNRMACALRVLAGLNLCDVLQSILNFLPREWDISFLDTLLPHIPGGTGPGSLPGNSGRAYPQCLVPLGQTSGYGLVPGQRTGRWFLPHLLPGSSRCGNRC